MIDFENNIAEKYNLDPDATRVFIRHLKTVEIGKNAHIVEKGGFNDNFYIVKNGILRAYIPTRPQNRLFGSAIPVRLSWMCGVITIMQSHPYPLKR